MSINIKFISLANKLDKFVPRLLALTEKSLDKIDREIDFIDSFVKSGAAPSALKKAEQVFQADEKTFSDLKEEVKSNITRSPAGLPPLSLDEEFVKPLLRSRKDISLPREVVDPLPTLGLSEEFITKSNRRIRSASN